MTQIFEFIMLICFGMSWPISVYKSITSKSTQGKSLVFIIAIIVGYVCGICGKLMSGQINYVLGLYIFNLTVVSFDLVLYFINKHNENKNDMEIKSSEKRVHSKRVPVTGHC